MSLNAREEMLVRKLSTALCKIDEDAEQAAYLRGFNAAKEQAVGTIKEHIPSKCDCDYSYACSCGYSLLTHIEGDIEAMQPEVESE